MQSARPINGDVGSSSSKLARCSQRCTCILLTEVVHISKDWAILDTVELVYSLFELSLILWRDPTSDITLLWAPTKY